MRNQRSQRYLGTARGAGIAHDGQTVWLDNPEKSYRNVPPRATAYWPAPRSSVRLVARIRVRARAESRAVDTSGQLRMADINAPSKRRRSGSQSSSSDRLLVHRNHMSASRGLAHSRTMTFARSGDRMLNPLLRKTYRRREGDDDDGAMNRERDLPATPR